MIDSYNIYCISNINEKIYKNNVLTSFKNLLPQNLDLKNKQWEIGIVKFGFQFDVNINDGYPSLISISTDIVIDSLNGYEYSTLVYDTSLLKSERNKYFYHYVKHIKYYPVRNTFIDAIKTEFFDGEGQKLVLNKGQPSFVHFHLKTMDLEETHYVRVDSKVNSLLEYNNTNNDFWVQLKNSITLNEKSKLALVDINFPNSIRTIGTSLSKKEIKITERTNFGESYEDEVFTFTIPAGRYTTNAKFIKTLNQRLPRELKSIMKFVNFFGSFRIELIDELPVNEMIICTIPYEYQNMLGIISEPNSGQVSFEDDGIFIALIEYDNTYTAPAPMNLMHDCPGVMLCHANFVEHSIVGNSFAPILKIIPTQNSSKDDYISIHFDNLEFIRSNVQYIKELHFQLKRLDGQLIEFDDTRKIILNFVVKN